MARARRDDPLVPARLASLSLSWPLAAGRADFVWAGMPVAAQARKAAHTLGLTLLAAMAASQYSAHRAAAALDLALPEVTPQPSK